MDEKCLIDPQRDCYGLLKASEVEKRLAFIEERQAAVNLQMQERLTNVEKHDGIQEEQYKHLLQQLMDVGNRNADSFKRSFDRLEDLEKQRIRQDEQYKAIQDTLESLSSKLDLLSGRVGTIEMKPAKRWEGIVGQVITILVAALVGLLLGRLGLA